MLRTSDFSGKTALFFEYSAPIYCGMCGGGCHTCCPGLTRWRTFSHIVTSNITAFQFKILHCALNIRSSVLQMATAKNPEKFDQSFDRSACPSFDFIHAGWRLITVVKESSPLFFPTKQPSCCFITRRWAISHRL